MFQRFKNFRKLRKWYVVKLKLVDARLYFVSIFVGLLTGLVAVPYHYCLYYFFNLRSEFFASRPEWYWHISLFLFFWAVLIFVSWLVMKMPLITGGGIPQTRAAINGRITYKHPFIELVSKFFGGILSVSAGLSLGREGPSVQIGCMWDALWHAGHVFYVVNESNCLLPVPVPVLRLRLRRRWLLHCLSSNPSNVLMLPKPLLLPCWPV